MMARLPRGWLLCLGLCLAWASGTRAQCLLGESRLRERIDTVAYGRVERFDTFLRIAGHVISACDGLPGERPTALAHDGDSFVVGFRDGGLHRYGPLGFVPVAGAPSGPIRALSRLGEDLYVATSAPGLFRLQGGGPRRTRLLRRRRVQALASEGETLHIGLEPRGHATLSPRGALYLVDREALAGCFRAGADGRREPRPVGLSCAEPSRAGTLPAAHLTSLASYAGALWVGTFDQGVFSLTGSGVQQRFSTPRFINALLVDGDTLLAAASDGLYAARREGGAVHGFVRVPGSEGQHVHDAARDAGRGDQGSLWLATGNGLLELTRGGAVHGLGVRQGLPSRIVYALAFDASGALWAGTLRGVARVVPGVGRGDVRVFSTRSGALPQDWVTALAIRRSSVLVGTYDHGVVELSADGKSHPLPRTSRLWINPHGIALEHDQLLLATMGDGLWSEPARPLGPLPSTDVTAAVRHGDALWVATRAGLARLPELPNR